MNQDLPKCSVPGWPSKPTRTKVVWGWSVPGLFKPMSPGCGSWSYSEPQLEVSWCVSHWDPLGGIVRPNVDKGPRTH